jgi:hypothetical protein
MNKEKVTKYMRFRVLTEAGVEVAVFWIVASCNLAEVYRRFRGVFCLHHGGGRTISEKSVNVCQTT